MSKEQLTNLKSSPKETSSFESVDENSEVFSVSASSYLQVNIKETEMTAPSQHISQPPKLLFPVYSIPPPASTSSTEAVGSKVILLKMREDLQNILTGMEKFRAEVAVTTNAIIRRLERIENAVGIRQLTSEKGFPITTIEELNRFIAALNDEKIREETIEYFKSMTPDRKETAVRFFRSHFSDQVLNMFNWRGEQGKLSFRDNKLFSLITDAWTSSSMSSKDLEAMFKEEMAKCRSRIKSARQREKSRVSI